MTKATNSQTATGCGCLLLLTLIFGGCVAVMAGGGGDSVNVASDAGMTSESVPAEELLTPAEQYKESVVFYTNGAFAYEAATLIDAEAWYAMKQPACDLIADGVSIADIEASLIDGFRQAGNDEEKASNMAAGFIQATTQPGVCE